VKPSKNPDSKKSKNDKKLLDFITKSHYNTLLIKSV